MTCTRNLGQYNLATKLGVLLLIGAVFVVQLFFFSGGINGNDFWWHIKAGEWIVENGRIPTTDIFSWYGMEQGISWTAHEWLSEVIFYFIYSVGGEEGVFFWCLLVSVLLTGLMMWQVKEYLFKNLLLSGIFFLLFAVLTSMFMYGRPHLFSYFLLFFELKILYGFIDNPNSKAIFFVPVIGCLWSNLHGGSANMAYILCVFFLICSTFEMNYGRVCSEKLEQKHLMKLGMVTLMTIGLFFVNPIGLKVFLYPYVHFTDLISMSVISEWQAPDVKVFGNLILYFVPIGLMTIGLFVKEKKIKLIDILIMLFFLYLFFRSSRFIMLWYIVACFYAFKYMPECPIKEFKNKAEKYLVFVCLIVLLLPLGLCIKNIFSIEKREYVSKVMSQEAIEVVKEQKPSRLFNDYNLGEYLIYNEIPVFFDARADLYSQQHIMEDGISLMLLRQANSESHKTFVDVEKMIMMYGFDGILILKNRPLYAYLVSHNNEYECVYEDENIGYFTVGNKESAH